MLLPAVRQGLPGYDTRQRRWPHLDTYQLQTVLVAEVARVECSEHGVVQAATPWSDPGSRFTVLFEREVIDWLKEASFSAVARRLGLTWDEVDGIMARAVTYMDAAVKWLPSARVYFDRFHVARHLGDAVNMVRKEEHKRLRAAGDRTLVGTKHLRLESPASMRPERRSLCRSSRTRARAQAGRGP